MAIGTPTQLGTKFQTGAATCVITTTAAINAGDLVVVFCGNSNSNSISSVQDTAGNTYTLLNSTSAGANGNCRAAYAKNATAMASGNSITVNRSSGTGTGYACAIGVSGMDTTAPSDINGTGNTATGTTPSASTGTLGQADELVVSILRVKAGHPDGFTEDAAFTGNGLVDDGTDVLRSAYKIVAATTTVTYAPTLGTSRVYAVDTYSFKGAAAAAAYTPFTRNTADLTYLRM